MYDSGFLVRFSVSTYRWQWSAKGNKFRYIYKVCLVFVNLFITLAEYCSKIFKIISVLKSSAESRKHYFFDFKMQKQNLKINVKINIPNEQNNFL